MKNLFYLFFCLFLLNLKCFSESRDFLTPVPSIEEVLLVDAAGATCPVSQMNSALTSPQVDWSYLSLLAVPSLSDDPALLPVNLLMVGIFAITISQGFLTSEHSDWLYQHLIDSWEEYWSKERTTDIFGFPEEIVNHITKAQLEYWTQYKSTSYDDFTQEVNNAVALISYIFTGDAARAEFIAEGGLFFNDPVNKKFIINSRSHASVTVSDYYKRVSNLVGNFCENNVCVAEDIVTSEGDADSWFTSDLGRYLMKTIDSVGRLAVGLSSLGVADPLNYGDQFMAAVTGHKGLKISKFITKIQKKVAIEQASARKQKSKNLVKVGDMSEAEKEFIVKFKDVFGERINKGYSIVNDLLAPASWLQIDMEIAFAVALNSFTQIFAIYALNITPVKNPLMQDLKTLNYQMTFPLGTVGFSQKTKHLKALEDMSLQVQSYNLPENAIGDNFDHHALLYIHKNLNQYYHDMDLDGQLMNAGVKFLRTLMAGALYWIGDYAMGKLPINQAAPMVMLFKSLALMGIIAVNLETSAVALIDDFQQSDEIDLKGVLQKREEVSHALDSKLSDQSLAKIAHDYQIGGFQSLDAEAKVYLASIKAVHELAAIDSSFASVLLLESLWARDEATIQFLKHMQLSDEKIDLLIESQFYPSRHKEAAEVLQSYLWKK